MKGTKLARTVELLQRGWLSALRSAQCGGVLALSQRVGDLASQYVIDKRWKESCDGARYMEYRILGRRKG